MGKIYITCLNTNDYEVVLILQMFYVALALLGNLIMAVSILAVLALKKALPPLPGPAAIGLYGVATLAIFLLTAYLFRAKALQVRL